jgi:hypothetical protein
VTYALYGRRQILGKSLICLRNRYRNIHLPGDNAVDNTVGGPATRSLFKAIHPLTIN